MPHHRPPAKSTRPPRAYGGPALRPASCLTSRSYSTAARTMGGAKTRLHHTDPLSSDVIDIPSARRKRGRVILVILVHRRSQGGSAGGRRLVWPSGGYDNLKIRLPLRTGTAV